MDMESCLSPIISNIYMEHFEKLALYSAQHKPSSWPQYVDNKFVVWPYGPEGLQNFLSHLNSLRLSIKFTVEIESDNAHLLHVLVIKKEMTLTIELYRKPAYTGR
jgi:hypothetical protein